MRRCVAIALSISLFNVGSVPGGIVTSSFYGFDASGYITASTIESVWDARGVASRMYFLTLHAGELTAMRKLTVAK